MVPLRPLTLNLWLSTWKPLRLDHPNDPPNEAKVEPPRNTRRQPRSRPTLTLGRSHYTVHEMNESARGRGPFPGRQTWTTLLFAHWPFEPTALRPLVPPELELDLYDGRAWVGIVPFRLRGLRVRGLPGVPTATNFLELNVPTYVRAGGRGGVYFFSLDAASGLAVRAAQRLFHLPYHRADISLAELGGWHEYRCHRRFGEARFEGRYRPSGEATTARDSTLLHFLVERYRLFVVPRPGHVRRVEVAHEPWPIQPALAEIGDNTMAAAAGLTLPDRPALVHYAAHLDVRTGPPLPA